EVDGEGEPVTVVAHGLTNSCKDLAMLTPLIAGSKVRFCFRGHGESDAPATGYRFTDFASDLEAVAAAFGATRAVGTSLGAGAICRLLSEDPARFEKLVFLLPAGLDVPLDDSGAFLETAEILETYPKDEAIERILARHDSIERYTQMPWMREASELIWADVNPKAAAQAIREVIRDSPVADRELLRPVQAPALIVCAENDPIHPVVIGEMLAEVLPNAELHVLRDHAALLEAIPMLVGRAQEILA
ncbi:MAG: alpha/beta hydrolase, partial [Actinomycetota bacterium]